MSQPAKILYNSSEIGECIKQLMANPLDGQRRVVLVAYVGRDYASFLQYPKDIESHPWGNTSRGRGETPGGWSQKNLIFR
jgi:hypothetical protein